MTVGSWGGQQRPGKDSVTERQEEGETRMPAEGVGARGTQSQRWLRGLNRPSDVGVRENGGVKGNSGVSPAVLLSAD